MDTGPGESGAVISRLEPAKAAKLAGIAAIVAFGAVFVLLNRSEVPVALSAFQGANLWFVSLAVVLAVLYLVAYAGLVWVCMGAAGFGMRLRRAVLVGTAAHFYNLAIVNSGGLGGVGVAVAEARRDGRPAGPAILGFLLVSQVGHLTFALVLGIALAVGVASGQLTNLELIAAAVFIAYSIVILATLSAIVVNERLFTTIHRFANIVLVRIRALLRLQASSDEAGSKTALELREIVRRLARSPKSFLGPVSLGVATELAGIGMLWALLRAFGVQTNALTPLMAYAAAVLFSIVGFLPAGIGFAEAGLGLALSRAGVDGTEIVLVVVAFRLLETWLPFSVGAMAAYFVTRGSTVVTIQK